MSNYTQTTFFAPKDALLSGNPAKVIRGADVDPELAAIAAAIATKYDSTTIGSAPIGFNDGTVFLPGITFSSDLNTGIYRPASDQVAVAVGGVLGALVAAAGVSSPAFIATGSAVPVNGVYLPSANTLAFASNTALRGSVNANGNWALAAASTGTTATITGVSGGVALNLVPSGSSDLSLVISAGAGNQSAVRFDANGAIASFFGAAGAANQIITGTAAGDVGLRTQGGAIRFSVDSGGHSQVLVTAAGVLQAVDEAGTLQTVGWRDAPQNVQGGSYTLALADRGKQVYMSGGSSTLTIPANASIAFPIGTTILVITGGASVSLVITSDTLFLSGTGGTGSRTLAAFSMVTLTKSGTTEWRVGGTGVS